MNKPCKKYNELALALQRAFQYKFISVRPLSNKEEMYNLDYNIEIRITGDYTKANNTEQYAIHSKILTFLENNNIKHVSHGLTIVYIKCTSIVTLIGLTLLTGDK